AEQRFSATFPGDEFFLADHLVKDQKVLPGVAHLEMARCAVAMSTDLSEGRPERTAVKLTNLVWLRPILSMGEPAHVNIGLFPLDNRSTAEIGFDIYEGSGESATQVFSQGTAVVIPVDEVPATDIEALKARCNQTVISSEGHYGGLKAAGLDLGLSFQGIDTLYAGDDCALARLVLPDAAKSTMKGFSLHPGLMDSALQAASCLFSDAGAFELAIPFSVKTVEIYGATTSPMWSFARKTDRAKTFDVELYDDAGNLCVRVLDIAFRTPKFDAETPANTLTLRPQWKEEAVAGDGSDRQYSRHLVLLCEPEGISREEISKSIAGAEVQALSSDADTIGDRFQEYAVQTFQTIQDAIRSASDAGPEVATGKNLIQLVVTGGDAHPWLYGLAGMLKTASLENPGLVCQLIDLEPPASKKEFLE
ncbi:MAG: polyketide synthase dehydratase domain-containing protein, partial [Desulfobacterales bacterium]|nr:polyketide synthase dehydratase domain-containing protein [Desulfobacterales bacterium]